MRRMDVFLTNLLNLLEQKLSMQPNFSSSLLESFEGVGEIDDGLTF